MKKYALEGARNLASVIEKTGRHGLVLSEHGTKVKFAEKAARKIEREYAGAVGMASVEGAQRAVCERSELSLGYETYLDAGFQNHEGGMVSTVLKSPLHRYQPDQKQGKRGKRGKIVTFSAASRVRLMQKVAQVRRGEPCHFVSLTFPSDIPAARAKEHLWAFWRRLERKYGAEKIGMIWKMEPQKRGVWHFHLLVWGIKYLPHMLAKKAWSEVIGSEDIAGAFHRGVDIKFVPSVLNVLRSYVAKYFSKDCAEILQHDDVGRIWGSRGVLPVGELIEHGMTARQNVWLWRLISRKRKKNIVKMSKLLFTDFPLEFFNAALKLGAEPPNH